jgi:hypothetical protein
VQRAVRRPSGAPASPPAPKPTPKPTPTPTPTPTIQRDLSAPLAAAVRANQSRQQPEPGASQSVDLSEAQLEEIVKRLLPRVNRVRFNVRDLTNAQLDEITHRLMGRITRLLRAELRRDRERIGRLRDTRY